MALSPILAQAIMQQAQGPDIVGNFQQGQQIGREREERGRQTEIQDLLGQAYSGQEGAMQRLGTLDPQATMQLQQAMGARDTQSMKDTFRDIALARNLSGNARSNFLLSRAKRITMMGGDATQTMEMLNVSPEEQNAQMDSMIKSGQSIGVLPKPAVREPVVVSKDSRLVDPETNEVLLDVTEVENADLGDIEAILAGSGDEALAAGIKAFEAVGGGKDGITAALKVVERIEKIDKKELEDAGAVDDIIQGAKEFTDMITSPDFAGAVGAADQFTAGIGAQYGSKAGIMNRRAQRSASRLILKAADALKGSMSDRDIELLEDSAPSVSDSEEVWADWYNTEYLPMVKNAAKRKGVDLNLEPINTFEGSPVARTVGRFKVTEK